MPLAESVPSQVSKVYAQGLFDACMGTGGGGTGGREAVEETMGELEEILGLARKDAQFAELLSTPAISPKERAASLERIFKGRVREHTLRFLLTLNLRGRLTDLPAIVESFDDVLQKNLGRVEIDVFAPAALSDDERAALVRKLGAAVQREVVLHVYVEPTMLGGIKVRVGDQLIDGSIATQLRALRERVSTDGLSAARAAMDRILQS